MADYMRLALKFETQANELDKMLPILESFNPEMAVICEATSLIALHLSDYCVMKSDDKEEIKKLLRKELKAIETMLNRLG